MPRMGFDKLARCVGSAAYGLAVINVGGGSEEIVGEWNAKACRTRKG